MTSAMLPNIVLIVMDSVPAKRCSVYGHERDTTPGLRHLASQGMLYRHCFAPATWTVPSHASLFTGLYPWEHGCNRPDNLRLPDNVITMADVLTQMGYSTFAVSCNNIVSPEFNLHYGFNNFYLMDQLINSKRYNIAKKEFNLFKSKNKSEIRRLLFLIEYCRKHRYFSFFFHKNLDRIYMKYWGDVRNCSYYSTERALRFTKKILKQHKEAPFFLFVNFMEAHYNYFPPARFNNIISISKRLKKKISKIDWVDLFVKKVSQQQKKILELLYDQELYYLDNQILKIQNFIEQMGLEDKTLVIVTADHGESFAEHGSWGHTFTLYNELIQIPLIVKYPRSWGMTGESHYLVQLQDIYATILEIAQSPFPVPDSSISLLQRGRTHALAELCDPSNYISALNRKAPEFKPLAFMQPCWSIIDSELGKLIYWADGQKEFYDLKKDCHETTNLIEHPEYATRGAELTSRLLQQIPLAAPSAASLTGTKT